MSTDRCRMQGIHVNCEVDEGCLEVKGDRVSSFRPANKFRTTLHVHSMCPLSPIRYACMHGASRIMQTPPHPALLNPILTHSPQQPTATPPQTTPHHTIMGSGPMPYHVAQQSQQTGCRKPSGLLLAAGRWKLSRILSDIQPFEFLELSQYR